MKRHYPPECQFCEQDRSFGAMCLCIAFLLAAVLSVAILGCCIKPMAKPLHHRGEPPRFPVVNPDEERKEEQGDAYMGLEAEKVAQELNASDPKYEVGVRPLSAGDSPKTSRLLLDPGPKGCDWYSHPAQEDFCAEKP